MSPTLVNQFLLVTIALILSIGALDAALSNEADLLVVLLMSLVLDLVMLLRIRGRRPGVPLRADLVRWLRRRAALGGESLDDLADRAVATYRASLERENEAP